MSEYIEREAVHSIIERTSTFAFTRGGMHEQIDLLPFADVAPVRHGGWIDAESDDGCTVWHCSKCSYPIKIICGYPIYKYCPMCGALMDGKEDGHEISE